MEERELVEALLRRKVQTDRVHQGFPKAAALRSPKESLWDVWELLNLGIASVSTNPSKLADLFSSTTPTAADACISALLSLAVTKPRGQLPAGGTDCSTLRSTIGRNGASFWAKRDVA
jgi:hypothetical protein